MKYCLIVGILFFFTNTYACLIEFYPHYIRSSTTSTMTTKSSTCNDTINQQFASILSGAEGTISNIRLKEMINKRLSSAKGMKIRPNKIKVETINSFLKRQWPLKRNWFFRNARLTGNKNQSIPYFYGHDVQLVCFRCDSLGEKTFRLKLKGQKKTFWGNVDIVTPVLSLTAKKNLRANSPLKENYFKKKIVYTSKPEHFFNSEQRDLKFFKSNRALNEGMPLKFSHLLPMNLVHPHRPVEVMFRRHGIYLNGLAMSLQSGRFGEVIRLKNIKNHKIIVGKVIGFDKVNIHP